MNSYKIFGFGKSGGNALSNLLVQKFPQDKLYYFDTDKQALETNPILNSFNFGQHLTQGLGSGANPNIGKQAFDEDKDLFRRLTKDDSTYFIIGGYGGGTFTGAVSKIAEMLSSLSRKFIVVSTFPFGYEGRKREAQAINSIKETNHFTDKLILVKNNDLRDLFGDLSMREAFQRADGVIAEIIKEIIFEINSSLIKPVSSSISNLKLDEVVLSIKEYLRDTGSLISTKSSKIIVSDTNKELLSALTLDPELIYKISPRKFEELIEYIYRLSGYKTELTKASRDDGADILVWTPPPVLGNHFLTVVQAKKYAKQNKVGSQEIRELIGTKIIFDADKAQIITTSDFSGPAIKTAQKNRIDLVKFYELNDTIKGLIN